MELKIFSILSLSLLLSSCVHTAPRFDGKFWAGDSHSQSIRREQENEEIKASDPAFDQYSCMSYQDLKNFYETYVLGCKDWRTGTPMMTPEETIKKAYEVNHLLEEHQHAASP